MNNNPDNRNNDNIDDILDILQKRKVQDLKNSDASDNAPTRMDTDIIKTNPSPKANVQSSLFDEDKNKQKDTPKQSVSFTASSASQAAKPSGTPSSDSNKKAEGVSGKPQTPDTKAAPSSEQKSASPAAKPQANSAQKPSSPAKNTTPKASSANISKTSVSNVSSISLDDFDTTPKQSKIKAARRKDDEKKEKRFFVPGYVKVILYLIIVFGVSIFLSVWAINIGNDVYAFVKDEIEVTVTIKEGATIDEVADELYNNGIIEYPEVYKMYAKLRTDGKDYYTGNFIAGEHELSSTMNYDKLISRLFESTYTNAIVKVTIPEGYTIHNILNLLEQNKVIDSAGRLSLMTKLNDLSLYDYDFLPKEAENDTDKIYLLEGYMFPDTYEFYVGENLDSIISKFLNNFNVKFDASFYDRCEELGMTVDEVITLASMIQAEGDNSRDFYLISSVFHNRLNNRSNFPRLESDATSVYAMHETKDRKEMTSEDIKNCDSPYNSYKNNGLPPGAICNPGHDAIHAALYPAKYITETDERGNTKEIPVEYYYFYTASSNGETYFSTTLSQHNSYIQKDMKGTLN